MAQIQRQISFLTLLRYRWKVYIERFKRRRGLILATWNNNRFGVVPKDQPIRPSRKVHVKSSKRRGSIEVHIYEPPSNSLSTEETKPLPVIINLHGSGFILHNLGDDAEYCTNWAKTLECIVLDMDYAKGPEYPYPAACDDILDVVAYVKANTTVFDSSRIALNGFSAGACLALLAGTQIPAGTVKAIVAWYPVTDFTRPRPSSPMPDNTPGVYISSELFDVFFTSWIRAGQDLSDPKLSPAFSAPGLFPATTFIVGDCDPLYQETIVLAEKLKLAGADCESMVIPNAGHAWDRLSAEATPQRVAFLEALKLMDTRLRAALQIGVTDGKSTP